MKKSDITTPILNIIALNPKMMEKYTLEFLCLGSAFQSSIERHKQVLGKQNYCLNLLNRTWIWEDATWRVYVSKRGVTFEVLADYTPNQAMNAWIDYYKKMGGKVLTKEDGTPSFPQSY